MLEKHFSAEAIEATKPNVCAMATRRQEWRTLSDEGVDARTNGDALSIHDVGSGGTEPVITIDEERHTKPFHYLDANEEDTYLYYDKESGRYRYADGRRLDHTKVSADQTNTWILYGDPNYEIEDYTDVKRSPASRTFLAAARVGDLDSIRAYFALPQVVSLLRSINAAAQQWRTQEAFHEMHLGRRKDWYADFGGSLFIDLITQRGRFHVLAWFLSLSDCEFMRDTVVVAILDICASAVLSRAYGLEIVEMVLASEAYGNGMTKREQTHVLSRLVVLASDHEDRLFFDQVIAHGADFDDDHARQELLRCDSAPRQKAKRVMDTGIFTLGENSFLYSCGWDEEATMINAFIECGVDARGYDEGLSPLQDAHQSCYVDTMELLLTKGHVGANILDEWGTTPLMNVTAMNINQSADVLHDRPFVAAEVLLHHGANVHYADEDGMTALHIAVDSPFSNVVGLLLEFGADPNARNTAGMTPLHAWTEYCRWGKLHFHGLKFLLVAGGDPYLPDNDGGTAYEAIISRDEGQAFVVAHPELFKSSAVEDWTFV